MIEVIVLCLVILGFGLGAGGAVWFLLMLLFGDRP